MESAVSCVEYDALRNNYYINDGSIRPTTVLTADGLSAEEPADGNIVELYIHEDGLLITAISATTGEEIFRIR